ncbi:MAG: dimethylsulfonioproprionate lyase family protein [Deltaproteobacteria bacterium]|jgi:hypothetical protein|nr:dimethylsulfonioproprionate lyase family protein [Deltaproteobacteria bacterium]
MNENHAMALIDILFDYLISIDDHCLSVFLKKWPSKPFKNRKVSRRHLPVLSYLPEIDVYPNEKSANAIKTLKSCADDLSWGQTYTAKDFGEAFLENYGWTELIGSRGPVASEDIACGFLLLGPNTEYPKHSHEAEEVYVPYNSQAFWIQGEEDWLPRPRGVPIYHKPWISHGMRSGSIPLLALYIWHGENLAQKLHIE